MTSHESFDEVIERVNCEIAEIMAEDRPFLYRLSANVLQNLRDRMQAAHDREVADAYTRGAATTILRYEHYNEVDTIRKREFKRGLDAGRQMRDADEWALERERRAAVGRLQDMSLDTGSAIKKLAIALGIRWNAANAPRSVALLQKRLVRLLGGTDGSDDIGDRDATADGGDGGHVQPREVADGGWPDDCHRAGDCVSGGAVVRVDGLTPYDELGNERHKAVCGLRMLRHCDRPINMIDIACAIGAKLNDGDHVPTSVFDRLIHLLGGDKPTLSDLYGIWKDQPNLSKSAKKANKNVESDAQIAESDENHQIESHVPIASITDELRELATDPLLGYASQEQHIERIMTIADRIDERVSDMASDMERIERENDLLQRKLDEIRGIADVRD